MAERVEVYDLSGVLVTDPENAIKYATNITIDTAAPKGYDTASFRVRRSDAFADWVVHESYEVIIWDAATIVFQGRIEVMPKDLQGVDEYITVHCVGWWVLFEQEDIRKRWIDIKGIPNLRWPDGLETDAGQVSWVMNKQEKILQVFAGTGDIGRSIGENFRMLYELPAGTVRRVIYNYIGRTGETLDLLLWNVDQNVLENQVRFSGGVVITGTVTHSIAGGATQAIELRVQVARSDTYDQNDYVHPSSLRVEANYETGHRQIASPTYTQGQLIEDIVLLVNQKSGKISTDFSQLSDPGLILDPFVVEEPAYAASVIQKIAAFGDASLNTWIPYVWDKSDTTDSKPRFVFSARSIADWEYEVWLNAKQLAGLNYEKVSNDLHNSVTVRYVNERDEAIYLTSADNAALADTTSITNEYQRDHYINIGDGDATRAGYIGQRYIQYHKDRSTRGNIAVQGFIPGKNGGLIPVNRVRAGERIKLLNTGEVFFITHTSYDAETKMARISPDQPVDNIAMLFAQRERNLGDLV